MDKVALTELIDKMKLKNLTPSIDISNTKISQPDINRPALQLAGFFEHFERSRVQIIGFVEYTYMEDLEEIRKREIFEKLFDDEVAIPCFVFCRDLAPDDIFIKIAEEHNVPILSTSKSTSSFMAEIIRWLNVKLAPCISVHGVLVDVFGEGVLITGESGIGKSEAALELIKRGHRLVTDDVVEIRKVSDDTLIGSAPDITRYLIELRGIGIVDVKTLFGVSSVKDTQSIDLVIKLEEWDKEKEYDRIGLEEEYTEYLGNKIVCHSIPIRPGRNLAIICESAAVNYRQKKMGYNAARELYSRVQSSLAKRNEEE
jgi:HPr kinase/phosphorylase